jgi:hypothetical protein
VATVIVAVAATAARAADRRRRADARALERGRGRRGRVREDVENRLATLGRRRRSFVRLFVRSFVNTPSRRMRRGTTLVMRVTCVASLDEREDAWRGDDLSPLTRAPSVLEQRRTRSNDRRAPSGYTAPPRPLDTHDDATRSGVP